MGIKGGVKIVCDGSRGGVVTVSEHRNDERGLCHGLKRCTIRYRHIARTTDATHPAQHPADVLGHDRCGRTQDLLRFLTGGNLEKQPGGTIRTGGYDRYKRGIP